ncbi:hypothetical protein [Pseudomonas syringae]|uniref:hypothetical protein n=1 Tax=Pseudomonas syringae TaxID=317 RepID=UPI001071B1DA|nr:hypothetical protein [Pseudomonas syringae]
MPVTITFDIEDASVKDVNDRGRIYAAFQRLGWENIGGSAWRYPALGTANVSEDWFNHVIPALMYFRSVTEHAGINVYNFTIDAHSEAGYRGRAKPAVGAGIVTSANIAMYPSAYDALSERRLRSFIGAAAASLE